MIFFSNFTIFKCDMHLLALLRIENSLSDSNNLADIKQRIPGKVSSKKNPPKNTAKKILQKTLKKSKKISKKIPPSHLENKNPVVLVFKKNMHFTHPIRAQIKKVMLKNSV